MAIAIGVVPISSSATAFGDVERRYEVVTPADKNGGNIQATSVLDDDHAFLLSQASFHEDDPGFTDLAPYIASRFSSGWTLHPALFALDARLSDITADLEREIIEGTSSLLSADQDATSDVYVRGAGKLELISIGSIGGQGTEDARYMGRSVDGQHVLFATAEALEPEDAGRVSGTQLYERSGDETRVVGLDSSEQLITDGGASLGHGENNGSSGDSGAISADGSRIFFESPDPSLGGNSQLYVRMDGETTIHVSASQRADAGIGAQPVAFQGAASDGSRVLFSTTGQLLDGDDDVPVSGDPEAGRDLYGYEVATGALRRISVGTTDATQNADVRGIVARTSDARTIYFSARGILAPGGIQGNANIYRYDWETEEIRLVASLPPGGDGLLHERGLAFPSLANLTPDGNTLVFPSAARLTSFDNAGHVEIYRYDAIADEMACISCNPQGAVPVGDADMPILSAFASTIRGERQNRFVSDDGSVVIFQSDDVLTPGDVNGRRDVYMWEEGTLSLVTLGTGGEDSTAVGITPDGSDAFFITYDRLSPHDVDDYVDLYDFRVGGGFPPPPAIADDCIADGCQGPPATPPSLASPSSGAEEAGNVEGQRRSRAAIIVRLSRAKRQRLARRLARGKIARLGISVRRPGKVVVFGRARVGRRSRIVLRAVARAPRAGRIVLRLRLSKMGRRELSARGRLALRLRVRHSKGPGASTLRVRLTARKGIRQ